MGNLSTDACCDAMEAETKPGDVVVVARSLGAGMTVRYLLPRAGQKTRPMDCSSSGLAVFGIMTLGKCGAPMIVGFGGCNMNIAPQ
jgi:hypothetical protein